MIPSKSPLISKNSIPKPEMNLLQCSVVFRWSEHVVDSILYVLIQHCEFSWPGLHLPENLLMIHFTELLKGN